MKKLLTNYIFRFLFEKGDGYKNGDLLERINFKFLYK